MSLKRVVDALRLLPVDSIPSFEVLEHPGIVEKVSGIDPYQDPVGAYIKALPCRFWISTGLSTSPRGR
jgi:hypothetical protein